MRTGCLVLAINADVLLPANAKLLEDPIMRNYEDCQTYIDHLLAEHRRLHRMLLNGRKTISGSSEEDGESWIQKFIEVLRDVRAELQSHFAEEEGGGCLDEAVSFRPNLGPELSRVVAQHPRLLAELDRLIAQAKDDNGSMQDRIALESQFDELCRELHSHEAAENEVLRRGFGVNVDGNENDELKAMGIDI